MKEPDLLLKGMILAMAILVIIAAFFNGGNNDNFRGSGSI